MNKNNVNGGIRYNYTFISNDIYNDLIMNGEKKSYINFIYQSFIQFLLLHYSFFYKFEN